METIQDNTNGTGEVENKSARKDESLAGLIRTDELTIIAASDPQILNYTAVVSYDAARVKVGLALLETAKTAIQKREIEWGEKMAATDDAHNLRVEFETRYFPCVKYAKIAHENNPEALIALGLNQSRKKTYSQFVDQADNFLAKLVSKDEYITPLKEFSISEDLAIEHRSILKEYITATAKQNTESGEAQTATVQRDTAVEMFFDWMDRYKKVVKVALEPYPKLLVKLGL